MSKVSLEDIQTPVKIFFPILLLLTIPLTVWVARTFRDPNIKAYSTKNADFDGNKKVDASDMQLFEASYLEGSSMADINGDGRVDSEDFALFSKYYRGEK